MGLGLKTMDNIHHILIFAYYLRISSKPTDFDLLPAVGRVRASDAYSAHGYLSCPRHAVRRLKARAVFCWGVLIFPVFSE